MMTGAEVAIECMGVNKIYRTKTGPVEALRAVDLTVRKGEFVAVVGPSGCGKSTLLHAIAGLTEIDSGVMAVKGTPCQVGRRDIGIMLQFPVLLPWRTVRENVHLPLEISEVSGYTLGHIARERVEEVLELVGLASFGDKYPWELSGGMQQRVSLARLLAYGPDVLLMDEPFSAVDELTRERLGLELLKLHFNLRFTVLYVTHNIHEAVFLADRVIAMGARPGQVVGEVVVPLPRPREMADWDSTCAHEVASEVRRLVRFGESAGESGERLDWERPSAYGTQGSR